MGELEGEMSSHLTQIVVLESRARKVVDDLKLARAEAVSRDNQISELETRLSKAEDRLLNVKEGHAMAESDLSKEAKNTALDSLGRESARAIGLEVALADTEHSLAKVQEEL